jgi:hypothetical protein
MVTVRIRFVPVCQLALRIASTVVGQTARPRRRGADGRRTAATTLTVTVGRVSSRTARAMTLCSIVMSLRIVSAPTGGSRSSRVSFRSSKVDVRASFTGTPPSSSRAWVSQTWAYTRRVFSARCGMACRRHHTSTYSPIVIGLSTSSSTRPPVCCVRRTFVANLSASPARSNVRPRRRPPVSRQRTS